MAKRMSQSRMPAAMEAEVLPASAELTALETDGRAIQTFIAGLAQFFRTAGELEASAQATRAAAEQVTLPTTTTADAAIQQRLVQIAADKKTVESHWGICQVLSRVHKRTTAARGRAAGHLDAAAVRLNSHHNTFVREQRARQVEEEARVRREAEARAREEQERRAAELDAEAERMEEASEELSEREQRFVRLATRSPNSTMSTVAAESGYKDGSKAAARLLSQPKIQRAIEAARAAEATRRQAEATREQPVHVQFDRPAVQVQKVGTSRVTRSARIVDTAALVQSLAVEIVAHTISSHALVPSQVWLNEQARAIGHQIERWPGVEYVETTKTS